MVSFVTAHFWGADAASGDGDKSAVESCSVLEAWREVPRAAPMELYIRSRSRRECAGDAICMIAECADGARLGFGKSPTLDSGLGLRGLHCPLDTVYDTYTVPCTTVPVPTVGGIAV